MKHKLGKTYVIITMAVIGIIGISGCGFFEEQQEVTVGIEFSEYCEQLMSEYIESDSLNAHFFISDPSEYGVVYEDSDYNLGDLSELYLTDNQDIVEEINELKTYNREELTEDEQLTYDVLLWYLNNQLEFNGTGKVQNLLSPSSGLISNISTVFVEYQFYDTDDVDHYLLYLKDVERYMDEVFEFLQVQALEGYFMPEYITNQVIEQCQGYIDDEEDFMSITFEDKIKELDLTQEEKQAYIDMDQEYLDEYYMPIYQSTIDVLESLKKSSVNDGGLTNFGEEGDQYYEALVHMKTSTNMSMDEVVELLDDELSDTLKETISIATSNPDVYTESYEYQPDFDEPEEVLEYVISEMGKDFPAPATLNYNIEYQNPACEVEGSIAYYVSARIDDIQVNNIKVNGSEVENDSLMLYQTLAHEGFPGHLYEFTYFYNNQEVPDIRKALDFIGATEGWAEYASTCALNYLDISDDLRQMIILNNIFSYIMVSRVDLGVNYEGWDWQATSDYLDDFIEVDAETVDSLYYAVIGDPGIYLPYTIGHILMDDLRETAENELKADFNAIEYHTWLLDVGIVPFEIYQSELEEWLK